MLIFLDQSLEELTTQHKAEISGLDTVLTSSFNGEHYVAADFTTILHILTLPLGPKARSAAIRLRAKIAYIDEIVSRAIYKVRICLSGFLTCVSPKKEWTIPVQTFSNRSMPQSVVLGENHLDAHAYIAAAMQVRAKSGLHENCNMQPQGGGGSQISVFFSNYVINQSAFCYCITDGDYRFPGASPSQKTKDCDNICASSSWPAYATDFQARDIENIIPISLIEDSYTTFLPNAFDTHKNLREENPLAANFVDVKEGLRYCKLRKLNAASGEYRFWQNVVGLDKLHGAEEEILFNGGPCNNETCGNCVLIHGLGAGVLEQVVHHFNRNSVHKLAERIDSTSTWFNVGFEIFYWCLADECVAI